MSDKEFQTHTDSLSKKLQKPIQKLNVEVGNHFSKIRRYASDIVQSDHKSLPWDSSKYLAESIKSLTRKDIIDTWDELVTCQDRCRVVSHVYGSSFPLLTDDQGKEEILPVMKPMRNTVYLKSRQDIFQKRDLLSRFTRNPLHHRGESVAFQMQNVARNIDSRAGIMAGVVGLGLASVAIRSYKSDGAHSKK